MCIRDRGTGRQHDDRDPTSLGAYATQHLEAVHVGQADVEDHEVVLARQRLVRAGDTAGLSGRRKTCSAQAFREERGDAIFVLDDQDLVHEGGSVAGWRGMTRLTVLPRSGTESMSTRPPCANAIEFTIASPRPALSVRFAPARRDRPNPVSYTHLTLPTILRV